MSADGSTDATEAAEAAAGVPVTETARRALKGTVVSVVGQFGAVGLRFASNIVLAHYLDQTAFGLGGMVFALTTGLWLISDVGIGATVIRSAREDERFINTAWTLSVLRGAILFALGCAVAWPASVYYDQPSLVWLVPLCSSIVLLLGSESMHIYTRHRQMRFGRVLALELTAQVAALAVSIPVAIYTRHVIALALAAVVSAGLKFALSHIILGGPRMRFAWDKTALKEIFSFGQWIFLSTLFGYLAMRFDMFSLGKLEGFALLGVYNLAVQITSVPNQIAVQVTNTVLTPVLTDAFRGAPTLLTQRLLQARQAYLPAGALLFLGAATTAPAFFIIFYPDRFEGAGPMAQVLMVPAWLAFLQEASSRALLAAGDGRGLALTNAVRVAATIVSTLVGFHFFGFWGFLGGNAVGAFVGMAIVGWRLRMHSLRVLGSDVVATVAFVVAIAAAGGIPVLVQKQTGLPAAWTTLVSCVVVCGPLALIVLKRIRAARAAR